MNFKPYSLELFNAHAGSDPLEDAKQVPPGADLWVYSLSGSYTSNNATGKLKDLGRSSLQLQNRGVRLDALFGTGAKPLKLFEPYYLPAGSEIALESTDVSGAANNIRANLNGALVAGESPHPNALARVPYNFGVYQSVGANGNKREPVQVPQGWDLWVWGLTATYTSQSFTIQVHTDELGNLFSDQTAARGVVGTLGQPFRFYPGLFKIAGGTTVRFELTDFSGSTNEIYAYLVGILERRG